MNLKFCTCEKRGLSSSPYCVCDRDITYDDIKPPLPEKAVREALGLYYSRHIPLDAIAAAVASFEYGAKKYSDRNWEKGLPWQQMIDSLKRHVEDFERRSDYDDGEGGSGLPQICMIMASAMMLTASVMREIGEDDRLIAPNKDVMNAKECAKWITQELKNAEERMK